MLYNEWSKRKGMGWRERENGTDRERARAHARARARARAKENESRYKSYTWQEVRRVKLQRRVRFDTSGWIELWRGSASLSTALLPDLIYIQVPAVQVVASVFRVATCGATLHTYFTYCNILRRTQTHCNGLSPCCSVWCGMTHSSRALRHTAT